MRTAYNAVALCYGSTKDRPLNIPGEYSANVLSARRFVGWYNGVPEDKSLAVDLGVKDVVVIGHGNVALDCARILLSPVDDILEVSNPLLRLFCQANDRTFVLPENGYYCTCIERTASQPSSERSFNWTSWTFTSRLHDKGAARNDKNIRLPYKDKF